MGIENIISIPIRILKYEVVNLVKQFFMSKQDLKNELHKLIDNTDDERVLNLLKEDLVAYGKNAKAFDDLSDLSPEDRAELEELANEDPEKDTINEEEYQNHIAQWHMRLSTKKRYINKLDKLLFYLENNWPSKIAKEFLSTLEACLTSINVTPKLV